MNNPNPYSLIVNNIRLAVLSLCSANTMAEKLKAAKTDDERNAVFKETILEAIRIREAFLLGYSGGDDGVKREASG
jgi:hypothetical protein